MNIVNKIFFKLKLEIAFLLEQKLGWRKPKDPVNIPKYLMKKYISDDPIIIDCGAHIGSDSVELARIFPNGQVHSFEPIPSLFKNLEYTTRKLSNIQIYQIALSNKTGKASFFVSSGGSDASSSLLAPNGHIENHKDVFFSEEIIVPTITLDEWALKNGISKIDLLWLDMQGFELLMLQASQKILKTVKAIHTEVSLKNSYDGAPLYPAYRDWLADQGFIPIIEAVPSDWDMGNVLFVRK